MPAPDSDVFRKAFGHFATGVTIVTAVAPDGKIAGMTASSFNSVSLDPPMVLWSAGTQAAEYEVFANCKKFAVHVLSESQAELSNRFATPGIDKFEGIDWSLSSNNLPVISGCPMCLQCETIAGHEVSDHKVLIGLVVDVDLNSEEPPLLYYGSAYYQLGDSI